MAALHRTAPSLLQQIEEQSPQVEAAVLAGSQDAPSPAAVGAQTNDADAENGPMRVDDQGNPADDVAGQPADGSHRAGASGGDNERAATGPSKGDATGGGHDQQTFTPGDDPGPLEPALPTGGPDSNAAECSAHAEDGAPGTAAGGRERDAVLQGVQVRACDWREALAAAPEPCSRRQGLAALAADTARPMPARLMPVLLPGLAAALKVLHCSNLPLPVAAATAAATAALSISKAEALKPQDAESADLQEVWGALHSKLVQAGAVHAEEQNASSGAETANLAHYVGIPACSSVLLLSLKYSKCKWIVLQGQRLMSHAICLELQLRHLWKALEWDRKCTCRAGCWWQAQGSMGSRMWPGHCCSCWAAASTLLS